jgi:protein involved in polysaccharide export with SLBB domain
MGLNSSGPYLPEIMAPGANTSAPPSDNSPAERLTQARPSNRAKASEFQKFVETATGRELPVFGSEFFRTASENFSPVDNAPVSSDYIVGPGDEMNIRAWGAIEVDYRTKVDRNGQVTLPKVGSFTVAGIKASALENHLRAQIGRLYTNFNLNVTLGQLRGVKVFVVGPARLPGVYTVASQSTLLSAVVAAGGPASHGSMRKVLLRRDGKVISEVDIYDFLVQGDKSKDVQLAAGDVVVFQPIGPRVALNGALDTPAIYELKAAQETVRDVLAYAGGSPVLTNPNRVQLERIGPVTESGSRLVEGFKLDAEGLQKPLRDGDLLTLLPISPQFANAVTLKGHVAQPLRYPFQPGMRISDLIPDQEALISPDFYRRKNLLVQVLDADEPGAVRAESRTKRAKADADAAELAGKSPALLFNEVNWDYAIIERLDKSTLSTQVIPFNLGKAVLLKDSTENLELQVGDIVTVYSQTDIRSPVSRRTRLVALEGEVNVPGIYQLLPGETLQQLVTRAGGFTREAYIYATEFSREATRQRQRENLDLAVSRLEALLAVQNARATANIGDTRTAEQAAAISNTATQAQISRLKRIQPNGRMTLELEPSVRSVNALPFLPLENGDRIMVPTRPGFVTVAGAVVNTNAYLWREDRTAGDYLDLAGIDEGADQSNIFILRANGTITSKARSGFFSGSIRSAKLEPGDAIVVPNQLDYETWGRVLMRNLKDISQIFSQFGLGAAAIVTLRR